MLSPGTQLGQRYRLLDRIAVGGMGEVWRAEDTVLERRVAVKALLPSLVSEPGFAKRFRVEAKTVAALSHPHIVNIHDYGETTVDSGDHIAYLVMEFVDGKSLAEIIQERGSMPASELMPVIAAVAEALQHAHDHGVIHRDIKPGNILVRSSDGEAVLTDFGIARSGSGGDLTQTGAVMGTASYIAPEQADGTGVIPASDMYSLGVVAYHALTGRRPFHAENPIELALHHVRTPTPPLPQGVHPGVAALIQRSMSKVPAERFATAGEMARAAHGALTATAGPPATSVMPPLAPGAGPNAGMVGMTGPPAGVAASPPGQQAEIHLSPAGAPRAGGRSRKPMLGILAGVLALALAGGMVWLLLSQSGRGDNPSGEEGNTQPIVETTDAGEPSPTDERVDPDDDDDDDDDGPPGFGCMPGADCDD